ncbi:MAG: hypothetical protein C0601_10235 [Candidatus Muiribacterium halophilum]|uniref:Uncharacterized protein n=1 Tax=Muiribacterium halophilum TaxID=2053465 RepID=A0A2N5ZCN5_MUIH1|nr:MAG: hypothetical protein C0601_10235 [Candidatus Muirbacterium halophilum]
MIIKNKIVLKTGIVREVNGKHVMVAPLTSINSEIQVKSNWDLKKGDIVKFAYFIPKFAFYLFVKKVVPVLDFMLLYIISFYIIRYYMPQYIEYNKIVNIIAAIIGFLVSLSSVIYFDTKTSLFDEFKPVVLAVLKNKDEK